MAAGSQIRYTLEWGNPRTDPPLGSPRIVAEEIGTRGPNGCPQLDAIRATDPRYGLGSGYSIFFKGAVDEKPRRRLSEAAKQSIRRKALERRQRAKNPLFADHAIASAVARNPEYYGKP